MTRSVLLNLSVLIIQNSKDDNIAIIKNTLRNIAPNPLIADFPFLLLSIVRQVGLLI